MKISSGFVQGFLCGISAVIVFNFFRREFWGEANPDVTDSLHKTNIKYEEYGIAGDKMRIREDAERILKEMGDEERNVRIN